MRLYFHSTHSLTSNRSLCAHHLHICVSVLLLRAMNVRLMCDHSRSLPSIFYCLIRAWLISFIVAAANVLLQFAACVLSLRSHDTNIQILFISLFHSCALTHTGNDTGHMCAYSITMALIYMPHKILFVFVTFQIDYSRQTERRENELRQSGVCVCRAGTQTNERGERERRARAREEVEIPRCSGIIFSSSPKISM